MATTLIIASFLIVGFIIRAILIRYTNWGSIHKNVSWEYVKRNFFGAEHRIDKQCPKCDLESDKLNWFEFRTSNTSWRHLAGGEGFYSECPGCNIVVVNITTAMN